MRRVQPTWGGVAVAIATLSLFIPSAPAAERQAVAGTVVQVGDGDSLRFAPAAGSRPVVVRLRDIDAPEICQVGGAESRQALADMALHKPATLHTAGHDVHGRTLGTVVVDAVDIGVRMVEDGRAWSTRSRWDQGPLVRQERMARALGRGLHAAGGAVEPWHFRQTHGPCADGDAAVAPPAPPERPLQQTRAPGRAAPVLPVSAASIHPRCDGRTRCAQMASCEEARFFLARCPSVELDGDGDGVPCERQWCGPGADGGGGNGRRHR